MLMIKKIKKGVKGFKTSGLQRLTDYPTLVGTLILHQPETCASDISCQANSCILQDMQRSSNWFKATSDRLQLSMRPKDSVTEGSFQDILQSALEFFGPQNDEVRPQLGTH